MLEKGGLILLGTYAHQCQPTIYQVYKKVVSTTPNIIFSITNSILSCSILIVKCMCVVINTKSKPGSNCHSW